MANTPTSMNIPIDLSSALLHLSLYLQLRAVQSVLWPHCMHVAQVHSVTSENQFHYTRQYIYVLAYLVPIFLCQSSQMHSLQALRLVQTHWVFSSSQENGAWQNVNKILMVEKPAPVNWCKEEEWNRKYFQQVNQNCNLSEETNVCEEKLCCKTEPNQKSINNVSTGVMRQALIVIMISSLLDCSSKNQQPLGPF